MTETIIPTRSAEQIDRFTFEIAISAAHELHSRNRILINYSVEKIHEELFKHKNISEEKLLFKMFTERIEAYNSQEHATQTRLSNMRYSHTWRKSSLFSGLKIDFQKIWQVVIDNPDYNNGTHASDTYKSVYDLYRKFIYPTL